MTDVWDIVHIHMDDFNGSDEHVKLMEILAESLRDACFLHFDNKGRGNLYAEGEGIVPIGLSHGWDDYFPKKHSFTVKVMEQIYGDDDHDKNEKYIEDWKIHGGRVVRYTDILGELNGYYYTENYDKAEEFPVKGKWRMVKFYAREGTTPDEYGRYMDYIGVVIGNNGDDFIIEPNQNEGNFNGIYIHDEISRETVKANYVEKYIKNGKEIREKEIIKPEENLAYAVGRIITICENNKSDNDEGKILFRFRQEKPLVSIDIPIGETVICGTAFWNFSNIASIAIPASIHTIQEGAFTGCSSLVEIYFGGTQAQWFMLGGYKELPDNTVVHCWDGDAACFKGVAEYVIPDGATKIYCGTFGECKTLSSVVIPEGVTEIGSSAFEGCTALASITIPEGVTEIGKKAFKGCAALSSVVIPASVMKIGYQGLAYEEFYHPSDANMEKIGSRVFEKCSSLTEIYFDGTQAQWFSLGGYKEVHENVVVHCSDGDAVNPKNTKEYFIPVGVTYIGLRAFEGYSNIMSVNIPDGVMYIGDNAYKDCTALTSVNIPEGVTHIRDNAFEGCSNLSSMTIPNTVTNICNNVFLNCTALTSVIIPDSVVFIGTGAFKNCTSLESVIIPANVASITSSDIVSCFGSHAFEDCTALTSVIISDGVTEIGGEAFKGCKALTSVSIPSSVTFIGDGAFYDCTALTEIHYGGTNYHWASRKNPYGLEHIFLKCNYTCAGFEKDWGQFGKNLSWKEGVPPMEVLTRKM